MKHSSKKAARPRAQQSRCSHPGSAKRRVGSLAAAASSTADASAPKPLEESAPAIAEKTPAPPVQQELLLTVEKPIYGGAFLARSEGKAVFVPMALPGEQVKVLVDNSKRSYAEAQLLAVAKPSTERIAPACAHFSTCGGCSYQHTSYAQQLSFKQSILTETLTRGGVELPSAIDVLSADPWRSRNRIRLAFDYAGRVGYRGRASHQLTAIEDCPIAAPLLIKAAQALTEVLREEASALQPMELSLFCNADESSLLLALEVEQASIKQKQFATFAEALQERIPQLAGAELLVQDAPKGRAPEPFPRSVARWGAGSLTYAASGFSYRVDHGAFFQVNRYLVDKLVERVVAKHKGALAWDLFAGVGLFARQLTTRFSQVVAVESAPTAKAALKANLDGTCGQAVSATTLEFLQGLAGGECSHRAVPDLIVVDPPRQGLGPEVTERLLQLGAPRIAAVSCDPATLARDLKQLLAGGYKIESLTLADLFPHTFHLETVVQLRRA